MFAAQRMSYASQLMLERYWKFGLAGAVALSGCIPQLMPIRRSRTGVYWSPAEMANQLKLRADTAKVDNVNPEWADWIVDSIDHNDRDVLAKLATIDHEWATRIGGNAPAIVGDDVRNANPTAAQMEIANDLIDACPESNDVRDAAQRAEYDAQYAAYEQKLKDALAHQPGAVRAVQPKLDVIASLLRCEAGHSDVVNSGVGVLSEDAPGPQTDKDYREAVVKELAPYVRAKSGEHGQVTGCGYFDEVIYEQATGTGAFGQAQQGQYANNLGIRPIPCDRIPRSEYGKFARETQHALRTAPLGRGEAVQVWKNRDWEYHRNAFGVVTERVFYVTLYRHNLPLTTYCGTKSPLDSCEQGGAWVMALYNAAEAELADGAHQREANKKNACRVRAWEAYHLSDGANQFRSSLRNDGSWISYMRYLPKHGAPMSEQALYSAFGQLQAKAKRLFVECGGSDPGQTVYGFWVQALGGGLGFDEQSSWYRTAK